MAPPVKKRRFRAPQKRALTFKEVLHLHHAALRHVFFSPPSRKMVQPAACALVTTVAPQGLNTRLRKTSGRGLFFSPLIISPQRTRPPLPRRKNNVATCVQPIGVGIVKRAMVNYHVRAPEPRNRTQEAQREANSRRIACCCCDAKRQKQHRPACVCVCLFYGAWQ